MSESTLVSAPPNGTRPTRLASRSDRARWVLLVGWILMLAYCVGFSPRESTLNELTDEIRAGGVHSVQVGPPGLAPGSSGYGIQHVSWRHGILRHQTDVMMVTRDGGDDLGAQDDGTAVRSGRDISVELRKVDPDLHISRTSYDDFGSEIYGWYVGQGPGLVGIGLVVATLLLLVRGPRPRWATRWAWFWLMTVPPGTLLFLALAGPTPGMPAPRPGRRPLRAGWAIVIAIVAAAFLPTWWPRD